MSDSQNPNYSDEGATDWRPGARLKKLREEANVSLDKIAKETLIPFNKLQFLEDDEYGKVGKEIFVIAYIRKYAKSMGISSDAFVEQFKFVTGFRDSSDIGASTPKMTRMRPDVTFSLFDKIKGWQVVGAILVVWLLSVFVMNSDEEVAEEPALSTEEQAAEALSQIPYMEEEHSPETPDLGAVEPVSSAEDQPAVSMASVASESTSETPPVLSAQEPVSVGLGSDTLVMSFSGECWVKVWDAKGEVIFAQLQNSGDNLRLSGEAPFKVILGNARAVKLLVNDRTISTEPAAGKRHLNLNISP